MRIKNQFKRLPAYNPGIDLSRFSDSKAGFLFFKTVEKEKWTGHSLWPVPAIETQWCKKSAKNPCLIVWLHNRDDKLEVTICDLQLDRKTWGANLAPPKSKKTKPEDITNCDILVNNAIQQPSAWRPVPDAFQQIKLDICNQLGYNRTRYEYRNR